MAFTDTFNTIKTNIQSAYTISQQILAGDPPFEGKNQWWCKYYNFTSSSAPTLSQISGKTPTKTKYVADTTKSQDWGWGNSYVGYMQCWVKAKAAFNLSTSFWTDDHGRIYLNGTSKATSTSCQSKAVTLNFQKGWNKVIIMWQEGSGGDGGYLQANLSANSNIEAMYGKRRDEKA
jgi:hypothetical protein